MKRHVSPTLLTSPQHLGRLVKAAFPDRDRFIVKVNWSSYSPGAFTDAYTLDWVLPALEGETLVVEGHTPGRIRGKPPPGQASENIDFYRTEDRAFRAREGLDSAIERHGARHVNTSEEIWSGRTVPEEEVRRRVDERFGALHHPEIYGYLPSLLDHDRHRTVLVDLTRIKTSSDGTEWSLLLKNLFGLLPDILRLKYHPPLPAAILDVARVYLASFPVLGLAEALKHLVIYDHEGQHSAGWGRYNLEPGGGFAMAGTDLLQLELAVAGVYSLPIEERTLIRMARQVWGQRDG